MDKELTAICGDAIEELKKIPDKSIRLIVTDPPYNLNKNYGNNQDNLEFQDYLDFSRKWLKESKRILTDDGTIYIFMGMRYISYIYSILEQELGMTFNSWITWFYTQGIGKRKGFSPRHDDILMFTKSPKKYVFNLDDIRVPQKFYRSVNNMRGANPGNVWEFSHMHYCNKNRKKHPTQKPEGLFERIILASSDPGDTILDPFVGSGTALRVCQQTKRKGIGIDINPEYIEMTKERLAARFLNEERNLISDAFGFALSISSSTSSLVSLDNIILINSDRFLVSPSFHKPINSPVKRERPLCFQNSLLSFAEIGIRLLAIISMHSLTSLSRISTLLFNIYRPSHPYFDLS